MPQLKRKQSREYPTLQLTPDQIEEAIKLARSLERKIRKGSRRKRNH